MADEACDRIFPNYFPSVLRVRLENGKMREACVSHDRSGPESPLSDEELKVKFHTNARHTLPADRVEELRAALAILDELDGVDDIMRPLRTEQEVGEIPTGTTAGDVSL